MSPRTITGRCPVPRCFNSGTPATHCGLCAECFSDLTPAKRDDLIRAEMAKAKEIVIQR
jgi:hypothetical protein